MNENWGFYDIWNRTRMSDVKLHAEKQSIQHRGSPKVERWQVVLYMFNELERLDKSQSEEKVS